MPGIRIGVVDDHPLFREGVARSLQEIGGFEVVGEGSSGDEALHITAQQRPDILLMDISMPGGGLAALASIRERYPDQKIVMLTVSESSDDVSRALQKGAKGYVLKGVGSRVLADILRQVADGRSYVSPDLSARLLSNIPETDTVARRLAQLTGRESQILDLVSRGLSNKHVAIQLDLQEKTVKHHMTRILAKLKVGNRTEAAIVYHEASLPR
jgi:DNA-binding NarL/FixJ family response regulator